ncbi:MAG: hypothetical protein HFJ40_07735 [Clostridia bacterium]|nr:hypothetical protein [Clostridia bacterium]
MKKYNGEYSKTLETERLILRKYNKDDFEMLYKNYVSDEKVPKYCTWKPCNTKKKLMIYYADGIKVMKILKN